MICWIYGILLILLGLIFLYILMPMGFKIILRKRFLLKVKNENCVYLTFDDGPNPDSTQQILNVLKNENAKATFFVIGEKVEKYPDIINNIINSGNEIGDHGYSHLHGWKVSPLSMLRDIKLYKKVIAKFNINEKNSRLYRPPFGKMNIINLLYCLFEKKKIIFWNLDPKDYANNSSEDVANYVITNLSSGSVILLHDSRSRPENSSIEVTIEALKLIVDAAKQKGYKFCTIKEGIKYN